MKENLMISTSWYGESQHLRIRTGFCDVGSTEKPRTQQKQQIGTTTTFTKTIWNDWFQSKLQVILVIQWMYHYNLGRMTRNPTRWKTSGKVSYEPLLSHIGITKLLRVPLQLPLGSTGGRGMIHVDPQGVILDLENHRTSGWSTRSGHQTWSFGEHFPINFAGILWFSLFFNHPKLGGLLGPKCWKSTIIPEKKLHQHRNR